MPNAILQLVAAVIANGNYNGWAFMVNLGEDNIARPYIVNLK
jgi:hypothetical protein